MGAEKAAVKSPKESEMSPGKQSSPPKKASMSVEYGNSELSDWDSDVSIFVDYLTRVGSVYLCCSNRYSRVENVYSGYNDLYA